MLSVFNFIIGFSICSAFMLLLTYTVFLKHINKTWVSISICAALLLTLSSIQYLHFEYFTLHIEPLNRFSYRLLILGAPPLFYMLCQSVLFVDRKPTPLILLHLLPILTVFVLPQDYTIAIAFLSGMAYCFWLSYTIYNLRNSRKQFDFILLFLGLFSVIAVIVLLLGIFASQSQLSFFYYFYTFSIGISFMLVCAGLIAFPNSLIELGDFISLNYAKSTIGNVDINQTKTKVQQLMDEAKLYQNENLNLSMLAKELELSSHQLSEFINTEFDLSFSQYIRYQRVEASKLLLKSQPSSSILSISLEVGFKSQSNFYVAFKSITGLSPGEYRKSI